MQALQEVGRIIEERWRGVDHAPDRFPEIAASVLGEARLERVVGAGDILDWAFRPQELPPQHDVDEDFGQPPLTIFRTSRFLVTALFWVDGTTTIHQHGFSGCFQVLQGSSIETKYRFDTSRELDGHFKLGRLRAEASSYLRTGDVRAISSGGGLVHSLFHLDRPSISLVVRTLHDPWAGPQFTYARPTIAFDPFHRPETRQRMVQLVRFLRKVEHPELEDRVGTLVRGSDIPTAFAILSECSQLRDRDMFRRLVERTPDAGARASFEEAFREAVRIDFVAKKRAVVRDADLRFFLAILLNCTTRLEVLALLRQHSDGADPVDQAVGFLRRLAALTLPLQAAGALWQPNLLDLPEIDDHLATVLTGVLRGDGGALSERDTALVAKIAESPALTALFA
jgi:hypothetical protein